MSPHLFTVHVEIRREFMLIQGGRGDLTINMWRAKEENEDGRSRQERENDDGLRRLMHRRERLRAAERFSTMLSTVHSRSMILGGGDNIRGSITWNHKRGGE